MEIRWRQRRRRPSIRELPNRAWSPGTGISVHHVFFFSSFFLLRDTCRSFGVWRTQGKNHSSLSIACTQFSYSLFLSYHYFMITNYVSVHGSPYWYRMQTQTPEIAIVPLSSPHRRHRRRRRRSKCLSQQLTLDQMIPVRLILPPSSNTELVSSLGFFECFFSIYNKITLRERNWDVWSRLYSMPLCIITIIQLLLFFFLNFFFSLFVRFHAFVPLICFPHSFINTNDETTALLRVYQLDTIWLFILFDIDDRPYIWHVWSVFVFKCGIESIGLQLIWFGGKC